MKRLLLVVLLVLLVGCAPEPGTHGVTTPTDTESTDGAQFIVTVIMQQPYSVRIIDTELHNVCYSVYDGGIFCMPYEAQ